MSRTIRSDIFKSKYSELQKIKPNIRKYEGSNIEKLKECIIISKNRITQFKCNRNQNKRISRRESQCQMKNHYNIIEHKFDKETIKYFG